jgi:hypothetical protein
MIMINPASDTALQPDPDDVQLAADLRSIVSDHPYCDPAATLAACAERLADDPHGDERAGLPWVWTEGAVRASPGPGGMPGHGYARLQKAVGPGPLGHD